MQQSGCERVPLCAVHHTGDKTQTDMNRCWSFLGGVVVYLFSSQLIVHFVRECICNRRVTVSAVLYYLKRESAAARLLGLWVRIPPAAWTSVSFECCVLYR